MTTTMAATTTEPQTVRLTKCPETGLQVVPLWIDGATAKSSPELTFPVYSAKQKKNVFLAQSANPKIAEQAADVALRVFDSWRRTSATFRRDLIMKAADIFESRRSEIVALQVEETSCEASWAGFNLTYGLANMREIASSITSVFGEMPRVESDTNLAMVLKEPVGPTLLISP